MKKLLSILLTLLIVFSTTACGINISEGELIPPSTDAPKNQDAAAEGSTIAAAIQETVLLDSDGVKVTAKELDMDGFMGPELKLLIENNSGKALTFQIRKSSVNGYMTETMMSVDVADGKKANDAVTFLSSDLEMCGISVIADMEFSLHIFDSDSWDTYLDSPLIQLKTSAAEGFVYSFDDSGDVVYEQNDIKIVVKGLTNDSLLGSEIVAYIENNSDTSVTVQTREVSINGFMVDPVFSCEIEPGKHALDSITILSSDLEDNAITEIQTVDLSFHIFDSESYETIQDSEIISLTFYTDSQ